MAKFRTKNPKAGIGYQSASGDWVDAQAAWEWDISLSVGLIEDIKEHAKLDLDNVIEKTEELAAIILAQPRKLVEVAYVCCQGQIKVRGLEDREFGRLFDREAVDGLGDALIEAILDFYPRSSAGRAIRESLPRILKEMDEQIYLNTKKRTGEPLSKNVTPKLESAV